LGNTASALSQLGRYEDARRLFEALCVERTDVASHCLKAALVGVERAEISTAHGQLLAEAKKRAPNRQATNQVESAIEKLVAGARDPALTSTSGLPSVEARFRLSLLTGRRPDAIASRRTTAPRTTCGG
jgi:hypothetical protein